MSLKVLLDAFLGKSLFFVGILFRLGMALLSTVHSAATMTKCVPGLCP